MFPFEALALSGYRDRNRSFGRVRGIGDVGLSGGLRVERYGSLEVDGVVANNELVRMYVGLVRLQLFVAWPVMGLQGWGC